MMVHHGGSLYARCLPATREKQWLKKGMSPRGGDIKVTQFFCLFSSLSAGDHFTSATCPTMRRQSGPMPKTDVKLHLNTSLIKIFIWMMYQMWMGNGLLDWILFAWWVNTQRFVHPFVIICAIMLVFILWFKL